MRHRGACAQAGRDPATAGPGAPEPSVETVAVTARFASARDLTLADVEGWFPFAGLAVFDDDLARIVTDLDRESTRSGEDAIAFEVFAHLATAEKP